MKSMELIFLLWLSHICSLSSATHAQAEHHTAGRKNSRVKRSNANLKNQKICLLSVSGSWLPGEPDLSLGPQYSTSQ